MTLQPADIVLDAAEKECLALLAHVFIRHGRPERALPLLRALARLFPADPDIAKGLSYASLATGDATAALAAAEAYRAAQPAGDGGTMIDLLRARALARLGRQQEAEQTLQQFLSGQAGGGRRHG